jgi:DEAD/DEAH box helicase domain-containing protein
MPLPPWRTVLGIDAVLQRWSSREMRACWVADRALPAATGRTSPLPSALHPALSRALEARGIGELYAHQARAFDLAERGNSLVVATPTASGKSLCFHLPVLDAIARDEQARALYIYPTKALARDQESSLGELMGSAELRVGRVVYDGDTPGDARRAAREKSAVVMTNPDMLSAGILPHHPQWARLFQRLRFVVIDELHTYRGVFGSHMAHVLARLLRVARFHGSEPTFLCATATIGNPREHAARLLGLPEQNVALLDQSGAPRGGRRVMLYNPPVVNSELGIRASYLKSAVRIAGDLIEHGVPTIVFGPSHNSVEIMLKYLRERLEAIDERRIMAYRGGYLPETRRQIERDLRDGKILGIVATNALELGIDIGSLDAVVCAGYPGSVAALWQRFGRAGRQKGQSVGVLVASSAPVDQYFARYPDVLLGAAAEQARIDPANVEIVLQHLKCAAFELPFVADGDSTATRERYACLGEEDTQHALRFLGKHGVVHEASGRFHWSADAYPASHVSLRNVGWDNFVVVDQSMGRLIAELDWRSAHTMLHEQAIYQHEAEQYQVEKLDYENHKAYVTKVTPDYFTQAMVHRVVSILEESATRQHGQAFLGWGEVSVVEKVTGYKKIKFYTHENAGYGDVRLPDIQMHTTSFWLTVPEAIVAKLGRATAVDALLGMGRALETVATIALMCEPHDIGQAIGDEEGRRAARAEAGHQNAWRFWPTLFLYDHVPGGVGLAERIYELAKELLERAEHLIATCVCAAGCPACVGPTVLGQEVVGGSGAPSARKRVALELLQELAAPSRVA